MEEDLQQLYSHLSDIQTELKKRRADTHLVARVAKLFEGRELLPIEAGPIAALSRTVATPNKEMEYFIDIAEHTGLQPVVLEYNGKFVAKNIEKYFLCKPHFSDFNKKEFLVKKLVDFDEEGNYMHDLPTVTGKRLKEVHETLFKHSAAAGKQETVDITEWFNNVRQAPEGYYFYFLSLFVVHGVLFENYLSADKGERAFFKEKVWPSFQAVSEYFGVKPLIFPLLPITHENREEWLHYPKELEQVI